MSTAPPDQSPRPTSDGRGSDSLPRNRGTSGPRYLYYRIYTPDAAIESNNSVYGNDQYLGRILTKSVAPPHTAASLKRHLRKIEGFPGIGNADLYPSLGSRIALEDSSRVALLDRSGPGSSEREPVAIVIEKTDFAKRSGGAVNGQTQLDDFDEHDSLRYVHYRLYDGDGEIATKTSFDETDSSLGRINVLSVAPPHTVASLKSRLLKAESATNQELELFQDLGSETPMSDDDHIDFFADAYPGSVEDVPLAIVEAPLVQEELIKIVDDQHDLVVQNGNLVIRALVTRPGDDRGYLPIIAGEFLQTNGKVYFTLSTQEYMAINAAGQWGYVQTAHVVIV